MFSFLQPVRPLHIEHRNIVLGHTSLNYTLKKSAARRSIGLRINQHGLTVNLPIHASEKTLHHLLQAKADWILSKLALWSHTKSLALIWQNGEKIAFRGEQLTLQILPSNKNQAPQLKQQQLVLYRTKPDDMAKIEKVLLQWYRQQAEAVFAECVAHFAPLLHVTPSEVRLTSARSRWGSCSSRGVVRLNWRLVKMPLPLIDYVVIHELAHLREMNHSRAFWQVVASVCPDFAQRRKELKQYSLED